mgnify:CR=1 FL=1
MTIKINDRVKENRENKIGIVTEINADTNRYLLDFPDNSFGWFGAKEIDKTLKTGEPNYDKLIDQYGYK